MTSRYEATSNAQVAARRPLKVSVVIPALNEEATVAAVVETVKHQADEVLVIDADSTDDTASQARRAGAKVVNWREALPEVAVRPGKGESLWRGIHAADGDVVVFVDADLEEFDPDIVAKLSAPFADPSVHLVKAAYTRAYEGQPTGGGRVTELTAKPLLRALFPELAWVEQPLGGEYAIRRQTALALPFVGGYGVEVGLLIDVYQEHGSSAIRQVDCGRRAHRNRPLAELAPMADVVAATVLSRSVVGASSEFEAPATRWPIQE